MTLLRTIKLLPILLTIFALSSIAPVPKEIPSGPVVSKREIRTNPDLRLYSVVVDLTDPHVHVRVVAGPRQPKSHDPWNATLMPLSTMAQREHFTAAINGSPFGCKDAESFLGFKYPYYTGNLARPTGWLVSDGVLLTPHPRWPDWPALVFRSNNHAEIGRYQQLPPDTTQAVAGTYDIVRNGEVSRRPDPDPLDPAIYAPRTAVGLDQAGTKLIFLVVDGRRPGYSEGISEYQVGVEMRRLGAWSALILDSGGSSTMALRAPGGAVNVVNRPSDGHDLLIPLSIERSVADCIGVAIDPDGGQAAASTDN
jgi:exopolysaccharide biosynthesis protein